MIPPFLFSSQEMGARLTAIRTQMTIDGIDAILTSNQANIRYTTGFRGEPHTLLLTQNSIVLFTSFRTLPWAKEQTQAIKSQLEICTASSPLDDFIKRLPSSGCTIGLDQTLNHLAFTNLQKKLPSHTLIPNSSIEQVRRLKSPTEIELLKQSQTINEEIFASLLPQIIPGMTERALQGLILTEIARREEVDGYSFAPIVATAGNAWEIHHLPDLTIIERNTMLLLDLGVIYQGYASDMTRTICLGKANPLMQEIYQIVGQAQETAIAHMKAGATTREIDNLARDIITQAGHERSFTHGLGHSIGLETHDPGLNLSPTTPEETLQPGMAFTVEPGIYLPDAFGVRTEDVVIINEQGNTNITKQPKNLLELAS